MKTSINNVKSVYIKEMIETLRDKRTLFVTIFLPIIIYPLMMLGMGSLTASHIVKMKKRKVKISITGTSKELIKFIKKTKSFTIVKDTANPRKLIKTKKADIAIIIPKDFDRRITKIHNFKKFPRIIVYYSETNSKSSSAANRFQRLIDTFMDKKIVVNFKNAKQSLSLMYPFQVVLRNIADAKEQGAFHLGGVLALMLVIMCISFTLYPAIDMAAGEKERGTMETLLISPASRKEIVLGKYFAIFTIAICGSLFNLMSMGFTLNEFADMMSSAPGRKSQKLSSKKQQQKGKQKKIDKKKADKKVDKKKIDKKRKKRRKKVYREHFLYETETRGKKSQGPEIQFTLSFSVILMILALLIPLTGIFSASALALSTFAKSYKEAQNYLTPIVVVITPLAMIALIPGVTLEVKSCFIPVTGVVLLYKELFMGDINWLHIACVFFSTFVYAAIALRWTIHLFEQESVLFKETEDLRLEIWNPKDQKQDYFSLVQAMSIFALALILYNYIGRRFAKIHLVGGNMASQYLFLVLFPLLAAFYYRLDLKNTFSFKKPKLKHIIPAILMILSALVIGRELSVLQREYIYGDLKSLQEIAKRMGSIDIPVLLAFLAFSITPGICEEFMFRGALLSSFRRRFGPFTSITIVAVLFAVMHLAFANFTFYLVLGIVLGYLVLKTGSIFIAMIAHAANNASALMVPEGSIIHKAMENDLHLPGYIVCIAVVVFLIGLSLLKKYTKEEEN